MLTTTRLIENEFVELWESDGTLLSSLSLRTRPWVWEVVVMKKGLKKYIGTAQGMVSGNSVEKDRGGVHKKEGEVPGYVRAQARTPQVYPRRYLREEKIVAEVSLK